ncbi:hypothetical protein A2Y83_00670 [Candidatus Falkowbacteria bacterium RBG_13_39_14]|uniref:Uncharacterized protein n=1 Tax=Candidatus Falkowbacteria bacterium RBG_13_39_14 TaxID=1797985 RepID=A0A1F5S236_9BACT|nr:MAG: hypothetical protein A2Y83_00670 [Candidatus Falkowbacteria bacterium RBG_13_39_14]
MALNNFKKVYETDHIKPLIKEMRNDISSESRVVGEMLRVFHRIVADVKSFSNLSCKRKRKLILYRRLFLQNCIKINFNYKEKMENLLALNSRLQPCYPELAVNTKYFANEIINWLERGKKF